MVRSRRDRRSRRARREGGSTLVELLVATAIMGSAVVAILTAMSATFTTSALNRQLTTAGIAARDYAEALEVAVPQSANWCSAAYVVAYTPPTGYTVSPSYGPCPTNDSSTPQFQTVTITATAPNGGAETLRTVVRKP